MSASDLVKGCPLFHEIYDNEVDEILSGCLVASYEKGDHIIRQGEEGTDIYVILSGKADISIEKEGQNYFIATISKGDIFGELVLINETKRTANITASDKVDVLVMTHENFFSYFHKKPKIFALMVLNVTRLVTKRLKASNERLEGANLIIQNLKKAA